jgi:hypothetical protein
MFDASEVKSAVDIQRRSYRLLRWLEKAIQNGLIRLERAHQYSSESGAAEAWLSEHYFNLPPDCRPAEQSGPDFRRFASFFASYLFTSFELDLNPRERRISPCGCFCPMCSYLSAAPHLKTKKVRSSDKQRAEKLKRTYLEELAIEANAQLSSERESALLEDPMLRRDLALAAYGKELLRRCNGHSSGPAVLALWRQFAWKPTGSPDFRFKLQAAAILDAERTVFNVLQGDQSGNTNGS